MPKSRKQQAVAAALEDTLATLHAEDAANAETLQKGVAIFDSAEQKRVAGLKRVKDMQVKAAGIIAESLRLAEEVEAAYAREKRVHRDLLGQVIADLSDDDTPASVPAATVHQIAARQQSPL